jgi:hypothetical protein
MNIEYTSTPNAQDLDYLTQKINEEMPYKDAALMKRLYEH